METKYSVSKIKSISRHLRYPEFVRIVLGAVAKEADGGEAGEEEAERDGGDGVAGHQAAVPAASRINQIWVHVVFL